MSAIDPITGQPLPANAIQRILFIGSQVHVYQIPPLTSTKGYTAATWTEDPKRHIFTARLRVLETGTDDDDSDTKEKVKVDVILEDPASGQLFAAAPYNDPGVIEPALDSSRFFAVRVQDGQGRRAMIGIGFEERPDAFDFGVALQEARKTVGLEGGAASAQANKAKSKKEEEEKAAAEKRDYSLKEGETITINLGGSSKFGRRSEPGSGTSSPAPASTAGFSLAPPPSASSFTSSSNSSSGSGGGFGFSLPPPPPPNRRTANRRSVGDPALLGQQVQQQLQQEEQKKKSAAELGFDDGQFGEFA